MHQSMTLLVPLKVGMKSGINKNPKNESSTLQARDYKGYSNQDMDYIQVIDNSIKQLNPSTESGETQPYQQNRVYDTNGIMPTLSSGNGGNTIPKIQVVDNLKGKDGHECHNVHSVDGIAPSVRENHGKITMIQVKSATKEGFEEAKEGDSINFSMPKSKTRRGRVGVGVAQTLDTQVNQGVVLNQSPTLSGFEHGTNGQLDRQLLKGGMIRRLTEIECERLQGYKDNWTKYGNYDGQVKDISRTQRYKLCGNAVTVNIVELIGIKLLKNINH